MASYDLDPNVAMKDVNTGDAIDNLNCKVAAVLEPGKVRTVTAGEARPYWLSRSFQKDIHSYIRNIPQFSLCGQPLEKWHFKFLDRKAGALGIFQEYAADGEETVWVSGDYSGATDEIDIRLTRACHRLMMERVTSFLDGEGWDVSEITKYTNMLDSCIETHTVSYPLDMVHNSLGSKNGDLHPTLQQNGQLMGSTLSFPILCIVNFCVAWLALWPEIQDFREVPILVNGDDILFRCRKSQYPTWCDQIKNAGFRKSIGKNFVHPDRVYINSQPWIVRKRSDFADTRSCEFSYQPFFNTGLMHGQSKVARQPACDGAYARQYMPTYALQPRAVEGALNQERAIRRFFSVHREHLRKATADGFFSYHAPREYLGLGMIPSEKARFTYAQKRLASEVYLAGPTGLFGGKKLVIGDGVISRPMHDLSRHAKPTKFYRGCRVPPVRESAGVCGYTVLQDVEHRDLDRKSDALVDGESVMFSSAIHLRKLATRLLKRGPAPPPLPEKLIERGFSQGAVIADGVVQFNSFDAQL
jgi:hypothetical protein